MTSRKKYNLGDFNQYATGKLADEYAAVADLDMYNFSEKCYLDERNKPCRRLMLLVGHSWRKSSGPPVWAHATGTLIRYYSGEGIQVNPLNREVHGFRVYYDEPFNAMSGVHDLGNTKPRITLDRKLERALVESIINFVFLPKGHLAHALNLESPDMLGSFIMACINFAQHRKMPKIAGKSLDEQLLDIEAENAAIQQQTQYTGHDGGDDGSAPRGTESTSTVPAKRSFADLTNIVSDDSSQNPSKRTVPIRYLRSYETETYAGLEFEVQALKTKLEEQEAKNEAIKTELTRQKVKRRDLRMQRDEWKEKYFNRNAPAETAAESVKQEEKEDWKAMLFEQERRTEHYKLKYIALKKKRKEWQAEAMGQEKGIEEHETRNTNREVHLVRERGESDHSEPQFEHANNSDAHIENGREHGELSTRQEPNMLSFISGKKTKPEGYKQLRKRLDIYWQRGPCENLPQPDSEERQRMMSNRLHNTFRELLRRNLHMGHDVTRQDLRTRVYIEAVEHIDKWMSNSKML